MRRRVTRDEALGDLRDSHAKRSAKDAGTGKGEHGSRLSVWQIFAACQDLSQNEKNFAHSTSDPTFSVSWPDVSAAS